MKIIQKIAGLAAGLCFTFNVSAQNPGAAAPVKPGAPAPVVKKDTLRLYNIHTDEAIKVIRAEGDTMTKQINWFMRDYRRAKPAKMDPALFDLLGDLQDAIRKKYPKLSVRFHVVSGYRTSETNENLRKAGGAQASNSQHIKGKAIDIRVPGLKTKDLRDIATCLKRGGVGYYAEDGFVHVDVGRVRYWPSRDYLKTLKCGK